MTKRAAKVARLVTRGKPCPPDKIEALESLVEQAKSGEVTSFIFVAIGPTIENWQDGWLANRIDRYSLLGMLSMASRMVQDREQEVSEAES